MIQCTVMRVKFSHDIYRFYVPKGQLPNLGIVRRRHVQGETDRVEQVPGGGGRRTCITEIIREMHRYEMGVMTTSV